MLKDTFRYKKYGAFTLIHRVRPIERLNVAPPAMAGGHAR